MIRQHGLRRARRSATTEKVLEYASAVIALLALLMLVMPAQAEPYLAVREGLKCGTCHVNPTGGGLRTEYGNLYAQMSLAASKFESSEDMWTGKLNRFVSAGGDLRATANFTDIPNQDNQTQIDVNELRVFVEIRPIPDRVSIYLDQRIAPGASQNREAWLRYGSPGQAWYLKAGQMYLPYGLRLEDDLAFIRQTPGISMDTPDRGVEFGWETGQWSAQLAVSNGTAGGAEPDQGKQWSARAEHVSSSWRAGASVNLNDTPLGNRQMQNLFAGFRSGPIAWLVEVDNIKDESVAGAALEQQVALLEANWLIRKGHNLKLAAEALDPDSNAEDDDRQRYSLVWEYSPFPYNQLRIGSRLYDGNPLQDADNRSELFVQWHGFF